MTAGAAPAAIGDGLRGTQYFAAHIEQARRIVAQRQSGSVQGDECFDAGGGVEEADGRARFKRFMGN